MKKLVTQMALWANFPLFYDYLLGREGSHLISRP